MYSSRGTIVNIIVIALFALIILRLFYIQVIDSKYKEDASNNALRYEILVPMRGEIYDRNGEFLVRSKEVYDLTVIPREVHSLDTALLCTIIGVDGDEMRKQLKKAENYSRWQPSVLFKQLPREVILRFEEHNFPGIRAVYRTIRSYPRKIAGNMLGEVGEVGERHIARDSYYRSGDYIGMSGIESAYEQVLRGKKGVRVNMVNALGVVQGSYANGIYDTMPVPGTPIVATIDAELQAFAEELLRGKVGSFVAIEPSTGEILVMANSPTFDPDELVGRERGRNYGDLISNPRRPLFNRSVMSAYPPGSTFKLINGLIGLQEGTLTPERKFPCDNGFTIGRGVACHSHWSPLNLRDAVQVSCNSYFCHSFKGLLESNKYGGVKNGFEVWAEYVRSFGFGRKLGTDFLGERDGFVPGSEFYNERYNGRWNALTVISLAIGQGELGASPLQMANLAATIANRGYYYVPHVVKQIDGRDSIDSRFYEKHYTMVDSKHFSPIIEGMYRAVHNDGGTAGRARVAGLDICGKTGTAQNPHGEDHSTFLCFAPRDNPKIAISVYVENGGFGGSLAAPIASLVIEKYLTDTITRPYLVDEIKNRVISYPNYDRKQSQRP